MKKFMNIFGIVAIVATLLVGCTKEPKENSIVVKKYRTVTITAGKTEGSRTVLNELGKQVEWDERDYENMQLIEGAFDNGEWIEIQRVKSSGMSSINTQDGTATFTFGLDSELSEVGLLYGNLYYRAIMIYDEKSLGYGNASDYYIKNSQDPTATSFDPRADVLIAKQQGPFDEMQTSLNFEFGRAVALNKLVLTNLEPGEDIRSVSFITDLNDGTPIVGEVQPYYDENGNGSIKFVGQTNDYDNHRVTMSYDDEDAADGTFNVYFTTAPVILKKDKTLTIRVVTTNRYYDKAVVLQDNYNFKLNTLNILPVNLQNCVYEKAPLYRLVTDPSSLNIGNKIVLANEDETRSMSITQNLDSRGTVELINNALTNRSISIGADTQVITLANCSSEEEEDMFAFRVDIFDVAAWLQTEANSTKLTTTFSGPAENSSWLIESIDPTTGYARICAVAGSDFNYIVNSKPENADKYTRFECCSEADLQSKNHKQVKIYVQDAVPVVQAPEPQKIYRAAGEYEIRYIVTQGIDDFEVVGIDGCVKSAAAGNGTVIVTVDENTTDEIVEGDVIIASHEHPDVTAKLPVFQSYLIGGMQHWNLSTMSYDANPTEQRISWSSTYVDMVNEKGLGAAVNNYIPNAENLNIEETRFYKNNTLTIAPKEGYIIDKIEFVTTTKSAATILTNSTWTNSISVTKDKRLVTVVPDYRTQNVVVTFGGTVAVLSVKVFYALNDGSIDGNPTLTLDKESLTFLPTGGEKSITATLADSQADITASSSNEHFSVSVVDNVITVTAPANASNDNEEATITVRAGRLSQTVSVLQYGAVDESAYYKLEITKDRFNGNGYAANDGVHYFVATKGSNQCKVKMTSSNVQLGNEAIQMKKADGKLYNENSLLGIHSIIVELKDIDNNKDVIVYQGEAANPSNTTVSGIEGVYFGITNGYFSICSDNDGATYVEKITVWFTSAGEYSTSQLSMPIINTASLSNDGKLNASWKLNLNAASFSWALRNSSNEDIATGTTESATTGTNTLTDYAVISEGTMAEGDYVFVVKAVAETGSTEWTDSEWAEYSTMTIVNAGGGNENGTKSVTYTISDKSTVTASGDSTGLTATYSQNHKTKGKMTTSYPETKLIVAGLDGKKITGITLNISSNAGNGGGYMTATVGNTTIASITDSKFDTANWNGSFSTTEVNITPTVTQTVVGVNQELTITIHATSDSLNLSSYTITYEDAGDVPTLSLSKYSLEFVAAGESKNVTATLTNSTATISASSNNSHFTVEVSDNTISITADENTDTENGRTGTITVSAGSTLTQTIAVSQAAASSSQGGGDVPSGPVTYNLATDTTFNSWNSTYGEHTETMTDGAVIYFTSANKQSGTITDCPVTKGGDVTLKAPSGKTITKISTVMKQWNTNAQEVTLNYSTDNGSNYIATSNTTSTFAFSDVTLPEGTNAVKFTHSANKQIGWASITVTYTN